MRLFKLIIDKYFSSPIFWDIVIVSVIWICFDCFSVIEFKLSDRQNQLNILPNIISADVSLAGFILAALTIIVTFKSNLKAKGIEEAENALEMIFSSKHYDSIVKVFKKSLIEFVITFVFIFFVWSSADNFSIKVLNKVNVTGILLTTFAIIRSLYILFEVLNLAKHKKSD